MTARVIVGMTTSLDGFVTDRLLTAQRGGEIHGATWQEIDLERGWWTIPKESSKNGLAHRAAVAAGAKDPEGSIEASG